jgi:hypothetical protein
LIKKDAAEAELEECDGHLYQINLPNILIQFAGRPLVEATKYLSEMIRCWACQSDLSRNAALAFYRDMLGLSSSFGSFGH